MTNEVIPKQLYVQNYPLWLSKTTELLHSGNFAALDIKHLIEELEEIGGSHKDALENNLIVVLADMIKWKYQPDYHLQFFLKAVPLLPKKP